MEVIQLGDVLKDMESHQPFDITYVRADKRRKVAGKMRTYTGCVLVGTDHVNSIRRVKLSTDAVRPIHIRLITHYNNKRVIY